ncbi:MAG: signal peptidase I [Propionibacteriaceae bacterium]|jgi:signal peptidase I|nr:signal peptidase I [Propionibacteriaceae bacterium]
MTQESSTDQITTAEPEAKPRPAWKVFLRWLGEFALYFIIALLVVALARIFLVQPYSVPSTSMENTLKKGDSIVVWKPGTIERGAIVVFRDDLGWLEPSQTQVPWWKKGLAFLRVLPPQDEQYLVKRLIGLPGDRVTCCDDLGRITVNGQSLNETEYLYVENSSVAQMPFDVVVPEGRVFVLGDHRDRSSDSRYHMCRGPLSTPDLTFPSLESIQGVTVAIVWPPSRWNSFSTPSSFAEIPEPTGVPPPYGQAQWTCL